MVSVRTTADRKVEFVDFENGTTQALVKSAMGYPAYYPVHDVKIETPLKAVLMDLDGTTVHSEHFWTWIILQPVCRRRLGQDPLIGWLWLVFWTTFGPAAVESTCRFRFPRNR